MKNKLCQMPLLLAALFGLLSCTAIGKTADEFEEGKYEVIDTGLEQSTLYGPGVLGAWLDNQRIVINVLKNATNPKKEEWQPYLVIFDVKTREIKPIAESVYLLCRMPETQVASIVEGQNDVPHFVDKKSRFVRMDEDGRISSFLEKTSLMGKSCRQNFPIKPDRLQIFLRVGDGYIDRGKAGGGYSHENAILFRPDRPPAELPIKGGDLNHAGYVPHLKLYHLSAGPSQISGKPVFILMTPEGEIKEIPQPPENVIQKITGKTGGFKGGPGGWLMRDGVVSVKLGPWNRDPGMFFIKGERVIRIYGANGDLAERFLSSPDGCTLAFLSFKNYDFVTKKTVKLINLCEEK